MKSLIYYTILNNLVLGRYGWPGGPMSYVMHGMAAAVSAATALTEVFLNMQMSLS